MRTLQLEDKETQELIDYYKKAIMDLEEKKVTYMSLLSKLTSGQEFYSEINGNGNGSFSFPEEVVPYNQDWVWTQKIKYVLKKEQVALDKKSIVEHLSELDNDVSKNKKGADRSVSATLSRQTKNGKFRSYYDKRGITIYGMPEWFDDGEIKPRHKKSILEDA